MLEIITLLLVFPPFVAKTINLELLQSAEEDKVYAAAEVDVKAKIKNKLEALPVRKSDCPPSVHVTLKVVLRKSGKVTDVTILNSSGCSYDQEAIKAASKLKFDPALKAGQPVSQYSHLEYKTSSSEWPSSTNGPKPARDQHLRYGLLLDVSGNKEDVAHIAAAAKAIINSNLPSDETFIVRFSRPDQIETIQDEKPGLLEILDELRADGGRAAIIDAVYVGAQHLLTKAGSNGPHALV